MEATAPVVTFARPSAGPVEFAHPAPGPVEFAHPAPGPVTFAHPGCLMAKQRVIEVRGARELRAELKAAGEGLKDLKSANQTVGRTVGTAAGSDAPRRTGRLAAAWRAGAGATKATVTFSVPYAPAVHWGTGPRTGRRGPHNIARNPFAWDAAVRTQPEWLPTYEQAIDKLLDRVKGAA
jgi:hypothetical protein